MRLLLDHLFEQLCVGATLLLFVVTLLLWAQMIATHFVCHIDGYEQHTIAKYEVLDE